LLFVSWCLSFPPQGGEKGHQESRICLRQYMGGNYDTLQEEHTHSSFSHMFKIDSKSYPTSIKTIMPTQALAHVREYAETICALILNTLTTPSDETMRIFCLFHPLIEVDLPLFIDDFDPNTEVVLNQKTFISTLAHSPHFFSYGPSSMVYELLQDYLSHMILQETSTFFSRYVGTLFKVIFHH
jgi:hypothetical protein